MKTTHKIIIFDENGNAIYVVTGSLERCYNYMVEKAIGLSNHVAKLELKGFTWELTYI